MLTQETLVDIHVQRELGKSIREIAKDLGISRNTVRRYLRNPALAPTYPDRRARPTKLDLTAASPSVIWR
jgi:transposase